ncbi:unnamed protein product, partial [Meganyctiphanes norvegica]
MEELREMEEEDVKNVKVIQPVGSSDHDYDNISENLNQQSSEDDADLSGCGGCSNSTCCDPRRGPYRFAGLFFMCFLGFGSYFCYDTPGSLQDQIKESMEVNTTWFSTLYSLYSWPNVILCFVGGFLIDRVFGIRWGAIIFSTLVTIGQAVFALGAFTNQFWCMDLGRFIFGIGGESLAVAQNTYTVSWFKGRELNTVFGLQLSMARVGSTVNFLTMGPLFAWVNTFSDGYKALGISLFLAGITCIFSLVCAFILGLLDKRRSRVLKLDLAESGEVVELKDVFTFKASFWLLSVICVTYYVAIFPFIGLAKYFFMRKYGFDEANANGVSSLVYVISAFASPVLGAVVDLMGRNILMVFIAVLTTLLCHGVLAFTFLNPYIPMSIMGLAYSLLASALWPMVALIIPEHQLGTAYGLVRDSRRFRLSYMPIVASLVLIIKCHKLLKMFMAWEVALLSTVIIWFSDAANGGILNLSVQQRKRMEDEANQ